MKVEWFGKEVTAAVNKVVSETSKELAEELEKEAIRKLISVATTTTERGLKSQFSIVHKKDVSLVFCQGPRNWHKPYHASFLEMGTYKDTAKPFMRPTLKAKKAEAQRRFKTNLGAK